MREIAAMLMLACFPLGRINAQQVAGPDTFSVHSGELTLKALVWHPAGEGAFPAVTYYHGNYATTSPAGTMDSLIGIATETAVLGEFFAHKGYLFFALFRSGTGLSSGQGESSQDLLLRELKEKNLEERNKLQVRLLETNQLPQMISGLAFLRQRPNVDTNRIVVLGHSFGGSLALLLAEHDPRVRAVVDFGAAVKSWPRSPELQDRLIKAVRHIEVPVLLIHAKNDYSTAPGDSLGALMDQLKKPHRVIIYPAFGNSNDAGHNFIFLGITRWEADVLRFLDEALTR